MVALRLTVLILMLQRKILECFFLLLLIFFKIFEIQNFLLEYFILLMQNWKCSWCKLMCLSMMLLNCEDYRFFILSSSLVFLSSTFFFAAVCELNCRALLFLCAQLMT